MSGNKGSKEVELEIFNRFTRIVKEKFTSLADDGNGAKMNQINDRYKQPEFDAEKLILNEMNNMGLYKGVMCGLSCFVFLRFSPNTISRILRRRAGAGTETQGPVNPFKSQASGYKFDTPAAQQNPVRPGLLFRTVRLALDTFVSLSVGSYASLYFLDRDKMMKQFSEIPLIEGRSLLSEELCGDFTKEFQKFDSQIWNKNHPSLSGGGHTTDDGQSDFRNTIQGFVANCRRRAICEEELRTERGLRGSDVVAIPSPGVPRDISVSLDDLLGKEEFGTDSERDDDGDEYFDTYFDMDDDHEQN
eukprot:CAMPEP_0172303498 /NCGR_PEP_ID=MMETSP1058-20130122/5027_1 /TAXON_ID=83371 /ORGANISM="Detonula confervacea, Strain CCMP 353" /LENGTH=302 /DNA_ID=CAMNT_0013014335 /DNA_START=20 /DNA_END=928 /DNA_ORIENTATION=-